MVTIHGTVNVAPVGHYHSIPLQPLFQPTGQELAIHQSLHPVHVGRVGHDAQCSLAETTEEWGKLLFAKFLIVQTDGRTVETIIGRTT